MDSKTLQNFFWNSVSDNDCDSVKRLIRYHRCSIDPNAANTSGVCALHQSCIAGNRKMMSVILKAGADVNISDGAGWTALHAAVAMANYKAVQLLLGHGANVHARNARGETAHNLSKDPTITRLLSQPPNSRELLRSSSSESSTDNETTDGYSTSSSTNEEVIAKRVRSGTRRRMVRWSSLSSDDDEFEAIATRKDHQKLFTSYVHDNNHCKLSFLLKANASIDLNRLDSRGLSPLHWASLHGFTQVVDVLLKNGATTEVIDPNGWTPLHAAVAGNNYYCTQKLLQHNAQVLALTANSQTVFNICKDQHIREMIEKFLKSRIRSDSIKNSSL